MRDAAIPKRDHWDACYAAAPPKDDASAAPSILVYPLASHFDYAGSGRVNIPLLASQSVEVKTENGRKSFAATVKVLDENSGFMMYD